MSCITKGVNARGALLAFLALAATSASAQAQSMLGQSMMMQPGMGFTPPATPDTPPPPPEVVSPPPAVAAPAIAAPAVAAPLQATPAPVSSCDLEMQKFQQRRNVQIEQINKVVKPNKHNQIDPVTACPKMRSLVSVETEMRGWMVKNKDWCSIPDPVMAAMTEGTNKTADLAKRACVAAAQARRGPPAAAANAAPPVKLPTGPL